MSNHQFKSDIFHIIKLTFGIILWIYLAYLLYFLIFRYDPANRTYNPPFIIWVIDLINLFIHEAGHFFFKIFGKTIYYLGGSLMQIILPFALFIVSVRSNFLHSFLPAFWTGESLINVSMYIKDAPYKQLKLISKNLTHDWNWILRNNLTMAETLSLMIFICGLIFCVFSIAILGYSITMSILRK